MAGYNEGRNKK